MKRLVLLSCLALAACGGSSVKTVETFDFAGYDGMVVPNDLAKSDQATTDLAVSPKAPVVTLVSPATSTTFTGNSLPLLVHVTSPAGNVISAVAAALDGAIPPVSLAVNGTTGDWSAPVDVALLASGTHTIVVTAADSTSLSGTLSLTYTIDHGPTIVFVSPTAATAKGSVLVKVTVDDPINGNANVVVTASVRNTNVPLTPVASTTPPEFDGTITFNAYTPPLNGLQLITVTAKNTTTGAVAMKSQAFTVDEQGPSIVIQNPVKDLFAAGVITVQALVTDDVSGVNDSSVFVVFGGDAMNFKVALTADPDPNKHLYTGIFDIGSLGTTTYVTPSVAVTALDKIGNTATTSEQILIDNRPPVFSLDPPPVRIIKPDNTYGTICTSLFDPVGAETLNDLSNSGQKAQLLTIRSQIEDEGNTASGQTIIHISGVDPATVQLYVISSIPSQTPIIAVDTNGDGKCDAVNPLLTQVANGSAATVSQYFSLPMVTLVTVGTPNYFGSDSPPFGGCGIVGDAAQTTPAAMLCPGGQTSLSYALQYATTPTPAIWSLSPVTSMVDGCVGAQFDDLNSLPEGNACFVVAGKDKSGNRGISAPLRTCIRRSSMVGHPCDTWTAPDCTGTYNSKTTTVSATPCTPLTFPAGQVRIE